MSIEAMKQALEALETLDAGDTYKTHNAATALRQAIEEAEMVEKGTKAWADTPDDWVDELRGGAEKQEPVAWHEPGAYGNVTTHKDWALANGWEPLYAAPVHAIDISQERVDETAKRKHEWVGLDGDIPGLGLVTEEFYNGMLCAEDILRKRNT